MLETNFEAEEIEVIQLRLAKFEDWIKIGNYKILCLKPSKMKKKIDKYYSIKNKGLELLDAGNIKRALQKFRKVRFKVNQIINYFIITTKHETPFNATSGSGTPEDPDILTNWIIFAAGFCFNNHQNKIFRNCDFRFLEIQFSDCENITFDNCKFSKNYCALIDMTNLSFINCSFDNELVIERSNDIKIEKCSIKHLIMFEIFFIILVRGIDIAFYNIHSIDLLFFLNLLFFDQFQFGPFP